MSKKNRRYARRTRKALSRQPLRIVTVAAGVLGGLGAAKEAWELVEWLVKVISHLR